MVARISEDFLSCPRLREPGAPRDRKECPGQHQTQLGVAVQLCGLGPEMSPPGASEPSSVKWAAAPSRRAGCEDRDVSMRRLMGSHS